VLIGHHPDRPVGPVGGWYALSTPLVQNAVTLRTWLAAEPDPRAVHDVLEMLFVDGLRLLYDASQHSVARSSSTPRFPLYRQRQVLHAMDVLAAVLIRIDGGQLEDVPTLVRDITGFVCEDRVLDVLTRSMPSATCRARVHGDLHAGNVLVHDGHHPIPAVIDLSAFGPAHWSTDAARLAVDLLMRSIDPGAESMFFTRFGEWRTLARELGEAGGAGGDGPANGPAARMALSWLVANLLRIGPACVRDREDPALLWHWRIALAGQFVRATYSRDVPGPKRVLALVAAHDQLVGARRAL
jgi:Phosphotransferase enzyme family